MSLDITVSPPLIRVTDTDGHVVLNTSEKMFYARPVDYVTGTLTTQVRNTGTNITVVHTLGSAHPSAAFVRGAMRVTTYGSTGINYEGVPVGRWINVSGTYVAAYTGRVMQLFTFRNNGGTVEMVEQLASAQETNAVGQIFQIGGITIDYRLICGQFT